MLSAICFNLDQSNIVSSGNGLTEIQEGITPALCKMFHEENVCPTRLRKAVTSVGV